MLSILVLSALAAAAQAQAPWPQADGSPSHSRAVPAWPRNSTLLTQLNSVPFCAPLLIGANGTLYGAASDGLLHAFAPSGRELWAVPLFESDVCSLSLALSDDGNTLFSYLPGLDFGVDGKALSLSLSNDGPVALYFPLSCAAVSNVNCTVLSSVVCGDHFAVLLASIPPAEGFNHTFALNMFSRQGKLQWSKEFAGSTAYAQNAALSSFAARGDFLFASLRSPWGVHFFAAFLISSGEIKWFNTYTFPNPAGFIPLLSSPDDSTILITQIPLDGGEFCGGYCVGAVNTFDGSTLWHDSFSISSDSAFASSVAGDYLMLYLQNNPQSYPICVETASGATSPLPLPPFECLGTAYLTSDDTLFCIMNTIDSGETLLLAFDIVTGSELLAVSIPLSHGNLAFAASGQLYLSSAAGLFTLLPPLATASSTPSSSPTSSPLPSLPPPSTAPAPASTPAPAPALPTLAYSALGATIGVAAALGAVAHLPRQRAWLSPQPPQGSTSPAPSFAATEDSYTRLN